MRLARLFHYSDPNETLFFASYTTDPAIPPVWNLVDWIDDTSPSVAKESGVDRDTSEGHTGMPARVTAATSEKKRLVHSPFLMLTSVTVVHWSFPFPFVYVRIHTALLNI
jgi:hypothetical protein